MASRIIILFLTTAIASGCSSPTNNNTIEIEIAGETFSLELSIDEPSRVRGLMDRKTIEPNGGMLFVFPDADQRSFWMANCYIDIDLIFLDSRGTITATHEMKFEPPQKKSESQWAYESRMKHYWSNGPARFAIELSASSIKRLHLRVNDRITLPLRKLRNFAR